MPDGTGKSRHQQIKDSAAAYGDASLHNYAQIRSLAERIAAGFCAFLAPDDPPCVHLVPAKGDFTPRDYGSAAFSVSGQGFLPLGPVAFGLALRVSETGDWLRITVTAMQEGGQLVCQLRDGDNFEFAVPVTDAELQDFFDHLYRFAREWFDERVRLYESGAYGGQTMGFELLNIAPQSLTTARPDEQSAPPPAPAPKT